MIEPRRRSYELRAALAIGTVLHGGLLFAGSFRRTYDAYVHLFFADHYSRGWFSTWEPRWYTGFTTVSYPPGSHQLLALVGKVVGLGQAFPVVALTATLLLIVGVYRFALIWTNPRAAGYAAILAAVSSSVAEALHAFGQLPTLLSLGLLLNGLPFAHRWIRDGGASTFAAGLACAAATTAAHHVTTLFGSVFFLGPVGAHAVLAHLSTPLDDESVGHPVRLRRGYAWPLLARRLRRVLPSLLRAAVYLFSVIVVLVVVVLPYWKWSKADPIVQIPIPHASRDSFLANPNAGLVFFVIPWGLLALALPYALIRGFIGSTWPLAASVGLLFVLGTGGTTPIPRLMLGGAFEVLTLDRFTFWATIAVLPLAGRFVESLIHGRVSLLMRAQLGRVLASVVPMALAVAMLGIALFSANLASYRPLQPAAIDPIPIVRFLEKDQHERWRYLTLGFGDQMAWLSAQTTAETVDGNYHSARRLPELTTTPVERLEGAKYSGVAGIGSLQQFLADPEHYHLKFVFSNDHFYDPLLSASGWQRLEPLENGVAVWQRDDVSPLPAGRLNRELPASQRLMWGLLPPLAMALAAVVLAVSALGGRWPRRWRLNTPRWMQSVWRVVDSFLARAQQRVPSEGEPPVWARWQRTVRRGTMLLFRPVRRRRQRLQATLVWIVAAATIAVVITRDDEPPSPTETVFAYLDALDLRDIPGAWDLLDPDSRPPYEQFVVERSVVNGLVASFARLDRLDDVAVRVDGDRAVLRANAVYVTALDERTVAVSHQLRRVGGRWTVAPPIADLTIPPDQLVVRSGVDYLAQGRRQATAGTTAYQDVVDRPELQVPSARLVRYNRQLSVVGEVINVDVDPAYITVQASLIGFDGSVLSTYTAAVGSAHTALPGEKVPFRVDFEGVAGLDDSVAPNFTPGARTPLPIDPADIAEVQVVAKALVTSHDLDRSLVAQQVDVVDAAFQLNIRNDGVAEVTVPHVFVTLRTGDGAVGWVDDVFGPEAVRPQRSVALTVPLTSADNVELLDVPVKVFANSLEASQLATEPAQFSAMTLDLAGWATADVTFRGFTRSVG